MVLLEAGHELLVFDDFSNKSPMALDRVRALAGPAAALRLRQMQGDICNPRDLEQAFTNAPSGIDSVIHFAGLKAVGESVEKSLHYWDVNVNGSRCLLEAMQTHGCQTLVFSSSATLYGYSESVPIPETAPIAPINPYGHTKAAVEQILSDLQCPGHLADRLPALSQPSWSPSIRPHWRKPAGHPQQPLPLREACGRLP